MHFHQLVMRFLEIRVLGRGRRRVANPLATLVIAPMVVAPQAVGLLFAFSHRAAILATLAFGVIFFLTYVIGMRVAKRGRVSAAAGGVGTQ